MIRLVLFIALFCLPSLPTRAGLSLVPPEGAPPAQVEGRGYQSLSLNPNGKSILFSECLNVGEESQSCSIYELGLDNGSYKRYTFPTKSGAGKQESSFARYSRDGQHVIAVRHFQVTNDDPVYSELSTFARDGSGWNIIGKVEGWVSSAEEFGDIKSVIYWKGSPRNTYKGTKLGGFDIYTMKAGSKSDSLFAGPFGFFDHNSLQIANERVIIGADGPKAIEVNIFEYKKAFNGSTVYSISKNTNKLPAPIHTDISNAQLPIVSNQSLIVFGFDKEGSSFFTYKGSELVARYFPPRFFKAIPAAAASSDLKTLVVMFQISASNSRLYGFSVLDTSDGSWTTINVPRSTQAIITPVVN